MNIKVKTWNSMTKDEKFRLLDVTVQNNKITLMMLSVHN